MKDLSSGNNYLVLIVALVAIVGIVSIVVFSSSSNVYYSNNLDSFDNPSEDMFGFASYPGYADPLPTVVVDKNVVLSSSSDVATRSFDVADAIVYRFGYVSYDNQNWEPFNLSPSGVISNDWYYTKGSANIQFTSSKLRLTTSRNFTNNTYVLFYSCSKNLSAQNWDCHGGWQILQFNARLNFGSGSSFSWSQELVNNGGFESGNFNGWTVVNGQYGNGWVTPLTNSNSVLAKSQSGNYLAYFTGASSDVNGVDFYIYQDVDLTPYINSITAGTAIVNISGWGSSSEPPPNGVDRTRIQFMFLNSNYVVTQTINDSTPLSKTTSDYWQLKASNIPIPSGTRYVRVWGTSYDQFNGKFDESGSLDSFSVKVGYGGTVVQPVCTTHSYSGCDSGDVYWFNSCNVRETLITDCTTAQTCSNGACVTGAIVCTGTAAITCTSSIANSATATRTRTCNTATGVWNNDGTCILGTCVYGYHVSSNTCVQDTVATPYCGDTQCNNGETCTSCSSDCGNCPTPALHTYYVSATSGSDTTGTGSSTAPWKTLANACSKAKTSGDLIYLAAGTYTETSVCNLAVGVSIEGAGPSTIIQTSVGSSTYTDGGKPTILLTSSSMGTNGNQHIANIKMDGMNLAGDTAIQVENRGYVKIYGCTIINFNYHGIYMNNGPNSASQPSTYAKGNEIYSNTITNSAKYIGVYSSGDSLGAIDLTGQDGTKIYNNVVTVARSDGLNGNCIDAVEGQLKNVKIYNNVLSKTFTPGKTWDFAIEGWNWYDGNEIYNNNITGSVDICRAWGKGTGAYSVWVHDNIIGQNSLLYSSQSVRGVLLENTHNDIIIERNFIKNVASGVFINLGYTVNQENNLKVSYNVFYNIGSLVSSTGWGIYYSPEDPADRQQTVINSVLILNNVFVGSNNAAYSTRYGIGLPDAGKATNVYVRNNIVTNFDSYATYANGQDGTTINNLYLENNIYYGNGNNGVVYSGITPSKLTTANTYTTNPLFVSSSDFHLQSASPAINAGVNVGLTLDKDKKAVSNPPEIGAYEFP